jgi:hypothetical protein
MKILRSIRNGAIGSVLALSMLSITVVPTLGCNQGDVQKAIALIDSQLPTAIALANTVISVLAQTGVLAEPNGLTGVGAVISNDLATLKSLCDQYEAGASASVYDSIVKLIDQIVTEGDSAVLQASGIKDQKSQAAVTAVLGGLDTILHVIDGYIQSTQTTAQIKATASKRTIKLNQVRSAWNRGLLIDGARQAGSLTPVASSEAWVQHEIVLGF